MEKSLFFNALPDNSYETGYDRNYNADDISDWLEVNHTTGIIQSTNGLKVVATTGMTIHVNAGKATIKGKPYINDNILTFTVPTAPTGATSRKDAIILRLDKTLQNRNIRIHYVTGDNAGNIPALQRSATIYELMLGYITVAPNTTSIIQANITDLRGDRDTQITLIDSTTDFGYCPYTTAIKGYEDYYDAINERYRSKVTVASQTTVVTTTLSNHLYKPATDLASVYLNGELVDPSYYTLSFPSNYVVITFTFNVLAGQTVTLVVDRFYNGEGLSNVLADYLTLKQQVENLSSADDYIYICNGTNDNVLLSQIAQTWLGGGTDYSSKIVRVYGTLGISAPNSGDGTSASNYNFFDLGTATVSNRRIIFDFSGCSQISATLTNGKYYTMFAGKHIYIKNANVIMTNTNAYCLIFDSQAKYIEAEDCRFWINALSNSYISRTGTFTNCRASVTNMSGNSFCFLVAVDGLVTVKGGEFYAYTAGNTSVSAVVGITSGANTVAILYGVNAPTTARSGFYQTHAISQTNGWVCSTDLISALPLNVVSGRSNIRGTIALSKGGYL